MFTVVSQSVNQLTDYSTLKKTGTTIFRQVAPRTHHPSPPLKIQNPLLYAVTQCGLFSLKLLRRDTDKRWLG